MSRKEGSSLCSFYRSPDPKTRAQKYRTPFLFHIYVCRLRCPCTMVHVISGEWSSPDAYTNSFNSILPSLSPRLLFAPVSNSFQHFPLFPALFLRLRRGVATMRRRGFVIVPRDRKSDAKAVAKADRSNTLMRLRAPRSSSLPPPTSPPISFLALYVPRPRLFRPPAKISSFRVARCGM